MKKKSTAISATPLTRHDPLPVIAAPRPGLISAWNNLWFRAVDPLVLHVVRVPAGIMFLAWLLPLAGQVDGFFGLQGWFDRQALFDVNRQAPTPVDTWSVLYLAGESSTALSVFYWVAVASVAAFTLGLATRITAVLTWLFMVSFAANPAMRYDGDSLLGILAFYLMVGYLFQGQLGGRLSPLERVLGSWRHFIPVGLFWPRDGASRAPSLAANIVARLIQIHLALIIVTMGLHKLQIGDWWAGVALWYPLHPPFETTLQTLQRLVPYRDAYILLLSVATYVVLVWELTFPLWAWRKAFRYVLYAGLALEWVRFAWLYELPFFGPFLAIMGLSFVTQEQLAWCTNKLRQMTAGLVPRRRTRNGEKTPVGAF